MPLLIDGTNITIGYGAAKLLFVGGGEHTTKQVKITCKHDWRRFVRGQEFRKR